MADFCATGQSIRNGPVNLVWLSEISPLQCTLRPASLRLVADDSSVLVLQGHMSATAARTHREIDAAHALSLKGEAIKEAWLFSLNQDDFDAFWIGRRRTAADGDVGQSIMGTGISS